MRKLFWLLLVVAVLGLACSAQPAAAPTGGPTPAPTVEVATEFTPTDPRTVNLAAGKPQLVEFYAVW